MKHVRFLFIEYLITKNVYDIKYLCVCALLYAKKNIFLIFFVLYIFHHYHFMSFNYWKYVRSHQNHHQLYLVTLINFNPSNFLLYWSMWKERTEREIESGKWIWRRKKIKKWLRGLFFTRIWKSSIKEVEKLSQKVDNELWMFFAFHSIMNK